MAEDTRPLAGVHLPRVDPVLPKFRNIPVQNRAQARKLLARAIGHFVIGKMSRNDLKALGTTLVQWAGLSRECELDELNDRIDKLEKVLQARGSSAKETPTSE